MYRVSCVTRTPSLPYGNLLTNVFQHFGIPLDSEECITQSIPVISAHSVKTLRFYKTKHRGWQHVSDLTHEEASTLYVTHLEPSSITNMAAILTELEEDNATLWSQVEHLQFDLGFLHKKVDTLVRLTSYIHLGAQLAISFQTTDVAYAAQSVDKIIHSTSSDPRFS